MAPIPVYLFASAYRMNFPASGQNLVGENLADW